MPWTDPPTWPLEIADPGEEDRLHTYANGMILYPEDLNAMQDALLGLYRCHSKTFINGMPAIVTGAPTWTPAIGNGWVRVGDGYLIIPCEIRQDAIIRAMRVKFFNSDSSAQTPTVYLFQATMNFLDADAAPVPNAAVAVGATEIAADSWGVVAVEDLEVQLTSEHRLYVYIESDYNDDCVGAVQLDFDPLTPESTRP